jgi:hypothetical protein
VLSDLPASGASATSVNRGYGVHMAVGLSIGFLFLGGACFKFNTSSSSVAMLLISMWPVLPSGPSDNRCHLQVLASAPLNFQVRLPSAMSSLQLNHQKTHVFALGVL